MRTLRYVAGAVALIVAHACVSTEGIPSAPVQTARPDVFSLVDGQLEAMSEEAIGQLLDATVAIPPAAKIAVLQLPGPGYRYTKFGYGYGGRGRSPLQSFTDTLRAELGPAAVGELTALPRIITPSEPTIPALRETAVRLQADALLVYQLSNEQYRDAKVFREDEIRAYVTVEAVLLDTRTGAVPFTSILSRDTIIRRGPADVSLADAQRRAEEAVALRALAALGRELRGYLMVDE